MESASIDVLEMPSDFDGLMERLRDNHRPIVISPTNFSVLLRISQQDLANLAHVHRNTIAKNPESDRLQKHLRDSLKVIRAAFDVSGDVVKALFWFRNEPLPAFAYRTPETLVAADRADDVVAYVSSLAAGAAG